jgi:hypothetical protein
MIRKHSPVLVAITPAGKVIVTQVLSMDLYLKSQGCTVYLTKVINDHTTIRETVEL